MASTCRVELEWGDGVYSFALRVKEIEELEAISHNPTTGRKGIGIAAVWQRLMGLSWYRADVTNVIRLGLIGGGMGAVEAMRLTNMYADDVPIAPLEPGANNPLTLAQTIIAAAILGSQLQAPEGVEDTEGESQTPKSSRTSRCTEQF